MLKNQFFFIFFLLHLKTFYVSIHVVKLQGLRIKAFIALHFFFKGFMFYVLIFFKIKAFMYFLDHIHIKNESMFDAEEGVKSYKNM